MVKVSVLTYMLAHRLSPVGKSMDVLKPLRNWLDALPINDPSTAQLLCRLIPAQCPFAREIRIMGRLVGKIPPLCKLNPLYNELMHLRFRALCYLAESR